MQTSLTAETPSQNGASIHHNPDSVTVSNDSFAVNVLSQIGYDLKLSLTNSWGFKPSQNSTITLILNGHTPNPQIDTDMLIVFSVNDWQYFSFFLHLDNENRIKNRIYPSVSSQNISKPVSNWISGPNTTHSRWDRISNNNTWSTDGLSGWKKQCEFPLKFIITNDPINHKSYFKFYHNITNTYVTSYTFNQHFITNENIDIYILGDSLHEQFVIHSFNIQLNTTVPTITPTASPTITPSYIPSQYPSQYPTYYPSNMPSKYPTFGPIQITTELPIETEANETILTSLYSTRNIISSTNIQQTQTNTHSTHQQDIYTTHSTVYINNTKIELVDNKSSSLGVIYLIIIGILLCFILCLIIFIIKYCCLSCLRSNDNAMKIRREAQIVKKMKSKSCSESVHTAASHIVDGINLVNIFEEIEEDIESDNEIIHKTTEEYEYGEHGNININNDEFIVESDSDNCVQNIQCDNGQLMDQDEIVGEYDMEGNQNDENMNMDMDMNMNRQVTVTNDMIRNDEFVVESDNDNDYTLGD